MAGEAEKKHRKDPAQMLEALQLLHPEALNLPEHGEIPSFIGSLVSRAKKGKTGIPGTRAPPVPENVKKLIRDLDSDWAATNHKVMRGDKLVKYTMLDVCIHLKAAHDSSGSLGRTADPGKRWRQGRPFAGVARQ
jgi:hypothetical protein